MNDSLRPDPPTTRADRAIEWIRVLAEIPERFAGTFSERTAAERIAEWMGQLGVGDVSITPIASGPRAGLALALHAGVGVLGCWLGGFVGVVLAVLAVGSFRAQFRDRAVLSRLLHPAASVNVIGRIGREAPRRRVILSAHIDAAQAGWIFSAALADRFARSNRKLRRGDGTPQSPLALPHALLVAGALTTLATWVGAHGFLTQLVRMIVESGLLITFALGLQWGLSSASPGANDNASAVAAMLTCAEKLGAALPADVELWLVGTGAEEVGCRGMHGFVTQHSTWPPESTYYVNFECVGGGALHIIRSEGMLTKAAYPPLLVELGRRVAAGGAFGEITLTDLLAATDGHVPAERGYPTLSLIALETNGVPRNYHRPEDTVDGIDAAMVVRAADFGAAVVLAALDGAAGPIASR